MNPPGYTVGQAVFIRTDTLDYAEESIPFNSLEEMVKICSEARENMTLEKVIVFSLVGEEPCALTLGFIAASRGVKPGDMGEQKEPWQ